jgi:hypothetical protein
MVLCSCRSVVPGCRAGIAPSHGHQAINLCLHVMALTQVRQDTAGRTYYLRKRTQGKGHKEAMRCTFNERLTRFLIEAQPAKTALRSQWVYTRSVSSIYPTEGGPRA